MALFLFSINQSTGWGSCQLLIESNNKTTKNGARTRDVSLSLCWWRWVSSMPSGSAPMLPDIPLRLHGGKWFRESLKNPSRIPRESLKNPSRIVEACRKLFRMFRNYPQLSAIVQNPIRIRKKIRSFSRIPKNPTKILKNPYKFSRFPSKSLWTLQESSNILKNPEKSWKILINSKESHRKSLRISKASSKILVNPEESSKNPSQYSRILKNPQTPSQTPKNLLPRGNWRNPSCPLAGKIWKLDQESQRLNKASC